MSAPTNNTNLKSKNEEQIKAPLATQNFEIVPSNSDTESKEELPSLALKKLQQLEDELIASVANVVLDNSHKIQSNSKPLSEPEVVQNLSKSPEEPRQTSTAHLNLKIESNDLKNEQESKEGSKIIVEKSGTVIHITEQASSTENSNITIVNKSFEEDSDSSNTESDDLEFIDAGTFFEEPKDIIAENNKSQISTLNIILSNSNNVEQDSENKDSDTQNDSKNLNTDAEQPSNKISSIAIVMNQTSQSESTQPLILEQKLETIFNKEEIPELLSIPQDSGNLKNGFSTNNHETPLEIAEAPEESIAKPSTSIKSKEDTENTSSTKNFKAQRGKIKKEPAIDEVVSKKLIKEEITLEKTDTTLTNLVEPEAVLLIEPKQEIYDNESEISTNVKEEVHQIDALNSIPSTSQLEEKLAEINTQEEERTNTKKLKLGKQELDNFPLKTETEVHEDKSLINQTQIVKQPKKTKNKSKKINKGQKQPELTTNTYQENNHHKNLNQNIHTSSEDENIKKSPPIVDIQDIAPEIDTNESENTNIKEAPRRKTRRKRKPKAKNIKSDEEPIPLAESKTLTNVATNLEPKISTKTQLAQNAQIITVPPKRPSKIPISRQRSMSKSDPKSPQLTSNSKIPIKLSMIPKPSLKDSSIKDEIKKQTDTEGSSDISSTSEEELISESNSEEEFDKKKQIETIATAIKSTVDELKEINRQLNDTTAVRKLNFTSAKASSIESSTSSKQCSYTKSIGNDSESSVSDSNIEDLLSGSSDEGSYDEFEEDDEENNHNHNAEDEHVDLLQFPNVQNHIKETPKNYIEETCDSESNISEVEEIEEEDTNKSEIKIEGQIHTEILTKDLNIEVKTPTPLEFMEVRLLTH